MRQSFITWSLRRQGLTWFDLFSVQHIWFRYLLHKYLKNLKGWLVSAFVCFVMFYIKKNISLYRWAHAKAARCSFFWVSLDWTIVSTGSHIFVKERMTWKNAQKYCRKHHDDLSTVNKKEAHLLSTIPEINVGYFWIGLHMISNNLEKWFGVEQTYC